MKLIELYKDLKRISNEICIWNYFGIVFGFLSNTRNAFISEKECRLLKNTETVLEFSCEYDHPFSGHFSDVFYRYVIEGEESKYTNCLIVRLEMPGGTAWFCIHREKPQD